ncbi:MAG: hypothetical protein ACREMU_14570, partial [Gemmatimonadaceae bacterium]
PFRGLPMAQLRHARHARNRRWRSTKRSLGRNWPRYAMMLLFVIASLSVLVLAVNGLAASGDGKPVPMITE